MRIKATTGAALLSLASLVATGAAACGGTDDQPPAQTPAPTVTAPTPPPPDTSAVDAAAPPPKPSMADMLRATEAGMLAAGPDGTKMGALYAPDAVIWSPGSPDTKGRDAIAKSWQEFNSHFDNVATANQRVWSKGNVVVIQFVTTGTDKASSKPVGGSGLQILTLNDDGLIATDHTYYDIEAWLKQTGAYKSKAPIPAVPALPTGDPERHYAKNDATETANAASLVAYNAAGFKKDDKAWLGSFSDDFQGWDFAGDPSKPVGKKALPKMVAAYRKSMDITAWKETNVIPVEDFTITEAEATVTQKTGAKKSATVHDVEIHQWKDGKIVKQWTWSNNLEMDTQLGTGPAAPSPVSKAVKASAPPATTTKP